MFQQSGNISKARGQKKVLRTLGNMSTLSLVCYKNFVFISKRKYKQIKGQLALLAKALCWIKLRFILLQGYFVTKQSFVLLPNVFVYKNLNFGVCSYENKLCLFSKVL